MKRGFTVVEVLVTLVVIAILLGLGTVGLRSTLVNGRDAERKTDAETIARGFETFYDRGITGKQRGYYPSFNELWNEVANGSKTYPDFSPGSSQASFTSPSGSNGIVLICIFQSPSGYWSTQPGCETPGVETKIRSSIAGDYYGYEPINSSGGHCYNADCTSFNLYWINEGDSSLNKISSKHQ